MRKNCWAGLATELKPENSRAWNSLQIIRKSEVCAKLHNTFNEVAKRLIVLIVRIQDRVHS